MLDSYSLRPDRKGFLIPVLVLISLSAVHAQEISISIDRLKTGYDLNISHSDYPEEKIISALREGLRAEITYQIRIYRKMHGLLGVLGDRLIEESDPSFEARWDIFSKSYVLTDETGTEKYFKDSVPFLSEILHSRSL